MNDNNDREYRGWLMHEMNYYGRYHDHKENMAWLATAFYITGIISVTFASRRLVDERCFWQTVFSIFIVIAAALVLSFIGWQFHKRRIAANNVGRVHKKLIEVYDNHHLIKFDDPPTYCISEVLTFITILGTTAVALIIACVQ